MKLNRESKIGAVTLIALVLFFWGLNFLKGKNLLSSHQTYYANYNAVNGLRESAYVSLYGTNVGTVSSITLDKNLKKKNIVVEFQVDGDIQLPADSRAVLYNVDLLGTKGIKIIPGQAQTYFANLDTLPTDIADGTEQKVKSIIGSADNIMARLDSITQTLNRTFNAETGANLQQSINNMSEISENAMALTAPSGDLQQTIGHLRTITSNIQTQNANINNIIKNIEQISDSLAASQLKAVTDSAYLAVSEAKLFINNMNQGKGSLGQLAQNDTLYNELAKATNSLHLLLEDLKNNPKRYVHFSLFGKNK